MTVGDLTLLTGKRTERRGGTVEVFFRPEDGGGARAGATRERRRQFYRRRGRLRQRKRGVAEL